MSIHVLHNGEVKSAVPYVKYNGNVIVPTSGWAKTGGELKQIWPPISADGSVYIYNQATLEAFRDRVNAGETSLNGKVIADFAITGEWTPIADYSNNSLQYKGTFDGGGHTITGLTISSSNGYQGLFGYIGSGGVVKDITLANTSISANNYVGAVVGYNRGTVENCANSGDVTATGLNGYAGGIVGNNHIGIATGNTNTGTVTGTYITTDA